MLLLLVARSLAVPLPNPALLDASAMQSTDFGLQLSEQLLQHSVRQQCSSCPHMPQLCFWPQGRIMCVCV